MVRLNFVLTCIGLVLTRACMDEEGYGKIDQEYELNNLYFLGKNLRSDFVYFLGLRVPRFMAT